MAKARLLACGAFGLGLLGTPAPAVGDADHVRRSHWRLRGPGDALPFEGHQGYRERLGPHSGNHAGQGGYLGYRERYGPAPFHSYFRPGFAIGGRAAAGPPLDLEAGRAAALEESGWTPLHEGRLPEALARLSRLAEAQPELPVPSAGLAVAAALQGDRRQSLEAMRRALTHLPRGLRAAPVGEVLRRHLRRLAEREAQAEGADAAFLAASFHLLAGDLDAAREAAARIPADPDEPTSTRQLRALLAEPAPR